MTPELPPKKGMTREYPNFGLFPLSTTPLVLSVPLPLAALLPPVSSSLTCSPVLNDEFGISHDEQCTSITEESGWARGAY